MRRRHRSIAFAALAILAVDVARVPEARAQSADTASALTLFEEGKRLASEGHFAEACPKLQASYNLVPKLGTLLNLADCFERTGRTASAWARFTEAVAMAERAGQEERAEFARAHAAALAPKLSRLVITVTAPAAAGIEVKRDGAVVDPAAFGTPLPVDPGKHVIEVRAPRAKAWSTTVEIAPESADAKTVAVPALEPETEPVAPVAAAAPAAPVTPPGGEPAEGPPSTAQRTWGFVVGGVGLAGVATSLVAGLIARSEYDKSNDPGGCNGDRCSETGLDHRSSASSTAGVATGLFIGGVALAGTGLVLILTAPSAHAPARTSLSVKPGSVMLERTW